VNLGFRVAGGGMCLLIAVFRGAGIQFYRIGLDVTVLEVGTALLVIAMQQGEQEQRKERQLTSTFLGMQLFGRLLRWFGRNSYEVYLTHMLVVLPVVMLYQHLDAGINTAPRWFLGATTLTGLAGFVAAKFYSEPLNRRLRARLGRAPSPAVVAATAE
jgi:peptidoglycan/LPS O-acetylase OafA/YrhL